MPTIRRFPKAWYASCGVILWVLLGAAPASAQSDGSATPHGFMQLEKGAVEVGAIFGSSLPVSWLRAHADRRITMASLDVGRVVTHTRGRGLLAGNFEFLLEITPFMVLHQPSHGVGLTASPLHMRWNLRPLASGRLGVFAEASGGVIYTNGALPPRMASFDFIDQAGFGVRIAASNRREWLAGYRFLHISNAGLAKPNPSNNFNFVYVGVSVLR